MKLLLNTAAAIALFSSPALAQDRNWTGPYIGANLGYAWGDATTTDDVKDWGNDPKFIGPFSNNVGGFVGGGTLGYNLQLDRIVLGVEADADYADLGSSIQTPSSQSGNHQDIALGNGFLGTVTGRVGFLIDPSTLIYAKGGLALYTGEATQTTTAKGYQTNGTDTFIGWTVGAGIERAITQNVSLKLEFAHYDFGTETGDQTSISDPPIGHVYHNHTDLTAESVRAGVAYKF